ncbi:MAG: hypothetical protein E6I41_03790 [Chloroflexi bacterium]|nr:MAG: hypothetical protein E6I41_03790 [Chloroflexota bacterium]
MRNSSRAFGLRRSVATTNVFNGRKERSSITGPDSRQSCSARSIRSPGTATGVTLQPATSSPAATAWPSINVKTEM